MGITQLEFCWDRLYRCTPRVELRLNSKWEILLARILKLRILKFVRISSAGICFGEMRSKMRARWMLISVGCQSQGDPPSTGPTHSTTHKEGLPRLIPNEIRHAHVVSLTLFSWLHEPQTQRESKMHLPLYL